MDEHIHFDIKILMIGNQSVGKTCIKIQFFDEEFKIAANSTVGIDQRSKKVVVKDKTVKI